jgi:hypothetical protein
MDINFDRFCLSSTPNIGSLSYAFRPNPHFSTPTLAGLKVPPTASLPQRHHCPMPICTSFLRSHEIRQPPFESASFVCQLSERWTDIFTLNVDLNPGLPHYHNSFCVFGRLVGFVGGNHSFCTTAVQSNGLLCDLRFHIFVAFLINNHFLSLFGILYSRRFRFDRLQNW